MPARLGQHFLVDEQACEAIIAAVRPGPGDTLLEIGPGKGVLTRPLLQSGARVCAVELDDRLAAALRESLAGQGLELIHADFLKLDLERLEGGPYKIAANLPYSVGAPILQKLLTWERWTTAVLMFQREVALRIAAATGGADYGLLTLSVRLNADCEYLFEVPPKSFRPQPAVSSAVIRLTRLPKPLVAPQRQAAFFRLAKAAFAQRRKMAAKVIAAALGIPRETVTQALARQGVPATARPEELTLANFRALAEELIPAV